MLLPEIGENLAQRIVETRRDATFRSLADFDRRVKGIGPLTIAKISPYLSPLPGDLRTEAPAAGKDSPPQRK
jgi:DNA uptake protein ComE-like DNA-binding protein